MKLKLYNWEGRCYISPDALTGLVRGYHFPPVGVHVDVNLDVAISVVGRGKVTDGSTRNPKRSAD